MTKEGGKSESVKYKKRSEIEKEIRMRNRIYVSLGKCGGSDKISCFRRKMKMGEEEEGNEEEKHKEESSVSGKRGIEGDRIFR